MTWNPTPGYISREKYGLKGYLHPSVHCSTVYNSQDMEVAYMSINKGIDNETSHIYTME